MLHHINYLLLLCRGLKLSYILAYLISDMQHPSQAHAKQIKFVCFHIFHNFPPLGRAGPPTHWLARRRTELEKCMDSKPLKLPYIVSQISLPKYNHLSIVSGSIRPIWSYLFGLLRILLKSSVKN